jgi:hypothetical protein
VPRRGVNGHPLISIINGSGRRAYEAGKRRVRRRSDPVEATLVEETFGMIPATLAAERSPFTPLRAAEIPTQPDSVRA